MYVEIRMDNIYTHRSNTDYFHPMALFCSFAILQILMFVCLVCKIKTFFVTLQNL